MPEGVEWAITLSDLSEGRLARVGAPGRPLPKEDAERIYAGPRTPERGAPTALESFETEFQYFDSGARRCVRSAIRSNLTDLTLREGEDLGMGTD